MPESVTSRLKLSRTASISGSIQATRGFLRKQLWAWPIIAAAILSVLGWWVYGVVGRAMREQMAAQVTTIRDADVTALRTWLKSQSENVELIVHDPQIVKFTQELLPLSDQAENLEEFLARSEPVAALRHLISQPQFVACGYHDFFLVSPSMRVLASRDGSQLGSKLSGYRLDFFSEILRGKVSVSVPYRSPSLLPDSNGELKAGLPTMLVAGPIRDDQGQVIAALGLRQNPEEEFTSILQAARSGESGETYAFDKDGLLLTQSRFDATLKEIGLLADLPDAQSILTLQLRDPQVNMARGGRPALKRADQPLTRMAEDAVAGNTGVDVTGYRDYRGVPTVGAWTWLPEYHFGVASEIDAAEAYRPLSLLRYAFGALFALLVLSAVAIFVFMVIVARQQRIVQKAVLEARQLGQYTLEERLGSGGMGTVYRARHALLRRPTAIKLLDPEKLSDAAIARFQREVQLTSQLNHPNTIAIYDYGKTPEGVFFYAMEYLDGMNLEDLVKRHGPLPEARVISILDQVCGSLAEAHGIGLIHRDIKPANIVLNNRGGVPDLVKVLDFGLVKAIGSVRDPGLTSVGTMTGTPQYLSPEAIEQPDSVDVRADIYAIGAVGYFLLTATPVFRGSSVVEICMQHLQAPPESPSQRMSRPLSPKLEALILGCLAKKREERPQSTSALRKELARCDIPESWSAADAAAWWRLVQSQAPPENPGPPPADTNAIGATLALSESENPGP